MVSSLERSRYYARYRSRHERRSMAIFQSLAEPHEYRVIPLDANDAERAWVPVEAWVKVEEVEYESKLNLPHTQQHWFMARLWQSSPTKRRKRKKTPDGRRSCYYDTDPCVYCGEVPKKPSTEHAIPKSHGGPGGWENRVSACYKCNTYRNNWPLILWLVAIRKHGSPRDAAKALGAEFPDRTIFHRNVLDMETDQVVKFPHDNEAAHALLSQVSEGVSV